MNSLNHIIQPERPSVSQIVASMNTRTYYVDNTFQRKLVWSEKQKIRLIETILIGYPMPEIYLWKQPVDTNTGQQHFAIVDGQQRLTSIQQFISNEYKLRSSALDDVNKPTSFANKFWKDLDQDDKSKIYEYVLNVRQIPSSVEKSEIRALFVRLNETDRSLNPQELRNARFDGKFLEAAEVIADEQFFDEWHVISASDRRRMGDVDFASQLLGLIRGGIRSDTPTSLNQLYDTYNDKYDEKESDIKLAKSRFKIISDVFKESELVANFFNSPTHLYTLFATLNQIGQKQSFELTSALEKFVGLYLEGASSEDDAVKTDLATYRDASSYRTRERSSRIARVRVLVKWLSPEKVENSLHE